MSANGPPSMAANMNYRMFPPQLKPEIDRPIHAPVHEEHYSSSPSMHNAMTHYHPEKIGQIPPQKPIPSGYPPVSPSLRDHPMHGSHVHGSHVGLGNYRLFIVFYALCTCTKAGMNLSEKKVHVRKNAKNVMVLTCTIFLTFYIFPPTQILISPNINMYFSYSPNWVSFISGLVEYHIF